MNKEEILTIRMDRKLRRQLESYARRNDNGLASRSARKAIELFLKENKNKQNEQNKNSKNPQC